MASSSLVLGAAAAALRAPRGRRSARPRAASTSARATSLGSSTVASSSSSPPAPPATRREFLTLAAGLLASAVVPASAVASPSPSTRGPADTPEVRAALRAALEANIVKTKAPAVLRLVFHDAGTYRVATGDGGLNGSVQYELGRPESFGLKRGLGPVTAVRDALRDGPADGLSLADVIVAAGAYAVELTGGPKIEYRLGRVDAAVADPENRMPSESLNGEDTRAHFAASGFDVGEMVALAGAHTIGGKGFGEPYSFDNEYYKTLLKRPWADPNATKDELEMASHIGLTSDKNLAVDEPSLEWIRKYADDQALFFRDFAAAYAKMSESGATFA